MHNIIVFLGPTLSLAEARAILPDAHYHSPVECGDILRVMRLKPDCIVIIDGLYERRAAVWHKEILCALNAGIPVVGASSMGALRAAELTHFGMIGVGRIYEDYYSGLLTDDDEVAVLHGPRETGYAPLNEALVSIRATVAKAVMNNIISPAQANEIILSAKKLHYPHRSLQKACKNLSDDFSSLLKWAQSGNYINQKKEDALAVLHHVKSKFPFPVTIRENVEKTIFIRNLITYANTSTFNESYDFLPAEEKYLIELEKKQPKQYQMVQELAQLLGLVYELAQNMPIENPIEHPLYTAELTHYMKNSVLLKIYDWIQHTLHEQKDIPEQLNLFKVWTRLIFGKHFYESEKRFESFVFQYALMWLCLDDLTKNLDITINADDVQHKTTLFMQSHDIDSMEKLQDFIAGIMTMEELNDMLIAHAYMQIVFKDRNFDFLLPNKNIEIINLLDCAHQSLLHE